MVRMIIGRRSKHVVPPDARQAVRAMLQEAVQQRASDVHLEPTANGYALRYRIDGLLHDQQTLDATAGQAWVNRLMVAAKLLTYRADVPQEGRCTFDIDAQQPALDLRVSVMPTAHGLRAVVRLPAELRQPQSLDELDLPDAVRRGLETFIHADDGMLLLTGPAGSGKSTTIYALLQAIQNESPGLSVVSLEDPVERDVPGVTQIEIAPFGELTYERALRSMLRQDPQVLALGEIRDKATASIAIEAALSGHRLISTLHAGTPAAAIARLLEMDVAPYQIAGALRGIASLRLARRLDASHHYHGRVPLGTFAAMDAPLRQAVLDGAHPDRLQDAIARQPGHASLRDSAAALLRHGMTDAAELERVLGEPVEWPTQ